MSGQKIIDGLKEAVAHATAENVRHARVHVACMYMRNLEDCKQCPEWEEHPTYGRVQRGCYSLANELVEIILKSGK